MQISSARNNEPGNIIIYQPGVGMTRTTSAPLELKTNTSPEAARAHVTKAGRVPWAATLLARSQLLEGAGGPYFGSARDYASSLASAINHIIKHIVGYA